VVESAWELWYASSDPKSKKKLQVTPRIFTLCKAVHESAKKLLDKSGGFGIMVAGNRIKGSVIKWMTTA
jgi:hypothetical protein